MMDLKTWLTIFTACIWGGMASAQNGEGEEELRVERIEFRKADNLVLEFTNDMWLNTPKGVELRGVSVGFKGYLFADYTFGDGIFSFAWGAGISADNVHSNARPVREIDEDGEPGDQIIRAYPDDYSYEKNKFVTTYAELPLELRVVTKGNSAFKMAVGFRLGYLLADHQKLIDEHGKRKLYDFAHITQWRYGVSARIGVGKFALTGYYSLTPLIEEGHGTDVIPVSVGVAFSPF